MQTSHAFIHFPQFTKYSMRDESGRSFCLIILWKWVDTKMLGQLFPRPIHWRSKATRRLSPSTCHNGRMGGLIIVHIVDTHCGCALPKLIQYNQWPLGTKLQCSGNLNEQQNTVVYIYNWWYVHHYSCQNSYTMTHATFKHKHNYLNIYT